MLTLATSLSWLLFLVPVAVLLAARSRRDRALWEIALDLPLAVALDQLTILLLARVLTLEQAVLLSRPLWLLGGTVAMVRRPRGRRWVWPRALDAQTLSCVAVATVLAVWLSMRISRECLNYDRGWHLLLVGTLRGQSIPFVNVYQPDMVVAYHYAGDVLASTFQVLSLATMHSALALALAHDVCFGLTAASLALLLQWAGLRRTTYVVLAVLASLLAGPATLIVGASWRTFAGYSFINFLKLSYKPHACLAAVLMVGFVGALLVRLRERPEDLPLRRTVPVLLACTGLLSMSDESVIGMLGLALGVTWLAEPRILASRRWHGLLVLVGLLVAVLLPQILFVGALSPGAPRHEITLVPWRSPGYWRPPLPLSNAKGMATFLADVAPMGLTAVAGMLSLWRVSSRERIGSVLFYAVLVSLSVFALGRLDVGERSVESHRFMTAAMFLFPMLGAWWMAGGGASWRSPRRWGTGPFVGALLVGAMGWSALSTLQWHAIVGKAECTKPAKYGGADDFFETQCRRDVGAQLGDRPEVQYLASTVEYLYGGCRPVFTAGPKVARVMSDREPGVRKRVRVWELQIGRAPFGAAAMSTLHRKLIPASRPLPLICPGLKRHGPDPYCARAMESGPCQRSGTKTQRCELSPEERARMVARPALPPAPPKPAPKEKRRKSKRRK